MGAPARVRGRRCNSSLWSVAFETTTPPTVTGLRPRDGRQRAGAAHLNVDALQPGPGKLGRELVRDGPSRRRRPHPQPRLVGQVRRPCRTTPIDIVDERGARLVRYARNGPACPPHRRSARSGGFGGKAQIFSGGGGGGPAASAPPELRFRPAVPTARPRNRRRTLSGARARDLGGRAAGAKPRRRVARIGEGLAARRWPCRAFQAASKSAWLM